MACRWVTDGLQVRPAVTRKALAEELGRSEKTVRRYLDALDRAGFHLDANEAGRFRHPVRLHPETHHHDPLQLITLSRTELILLYLHLAGIHHAGNPALRQRLWRKIQNALGAEHVDASRLSAMLTGFDKAYKSYDTPQARAVLATLLEALYRRHTCRVSYRTPADERPRTYRIEPHQLFEFDGGLYCYCRVPRFDSVRVLAVERIRARTLNDEPFETTEPTRSAIEAERQQAFRIIADGKPLRVRLRFSREQAPYVTERVWHPSQRFRHHDDGSLTMTFTASGRFEIVRWILGWGADCEVLAPQDLRREVATKLRAALGQYEG